MPGGIPPALQEEIFFPAGPATSFALAGQISEGSDRRIKINFPTALAEAMEFQKGEIIEWIIEDKANIIARRPVVPPSPVTIAEKIRRAALESMGGALEAVRAKGLHHRLLHAPPARTSAGSSRVPRASCCLRADHSPRKRGQRRQVARNPAQKKEGKRPRPGPGPSPVEESIL
jgi:hypothetical protein